MTGQMTGKLVVFEGGEGSGKTTQLRRLTTWLSQEQQQQGLKWTTYFTDLIVTRQPGGTELGGSLRQMLLQTGESNRPLAIAPQTELLLYAADRSQHVAELLRPSLEQRALVLCDRYTDSTIAYQGYGRGLDLHLIHQLNHIATAGLQSHLTFWLDVDVELGLARARQRGTIDRIEQTDLGFHRRVRQGFQDLAQAHPDRIVRIDAQGDEGQVAAQVQAIFAQRFYQWCAP
ncbi:MAG: dTMP kinase [Synechococcales bacterium]|nr:dTMP kinase [Synechococcales bacterium]